MEENDKTCAVCFSRMGDIAAEEQKEAQAEPVEQDSGDDWSDMTESIEELYTEQKKLQSKQGVSVGSECVQCGVVICHDCLVDWTVTTVKGIHVPESAESQNSNSWFIHNRFQILWFILKCSSSACQRKYSVTEIEEILGPKRFEAVSFALSKRIIQSSEDYVACPDTACGSYSFFTDEFGDKFTETECRQSFQCSACDQRWNSPLQLKHNQSYLKRLSTFNPTELTLYSNLYKVFFTEVCPSCKVSIVRTGGCKFMECSKCKYQFCWYCLDAFYTEYHFNETNCPFRYCFLHSIQVCCLLLIIAKICCISETARAQFVYLAIFDLNSKTFLATFLWHTAVASLMGYQVMLLILSYARKKDQKRQLDKLQKQVQRQFAVSQQTRRRLRQLQRKVESKDSYLRRGILQLGMNVLMVNLLCNRIGINFQRLVQIFVFGTLFGMFSIKKVRRALTKISRQEHVEEE